MPTTETARRMPPLAAVHRASLTAVTPWRGLRVAIEPPAPPMPSTEPFGVVRAIAPLDSAPDSRLNDGGQRIAGRVPAGIVGSAERLGVMLAVAPRDGATSGRITNTRGRDDTPPLPLRVMGGALSSRPRRFLAAIDRARGFHGVRPRRRHRL